MKWLVKTLDSLLPYASEQESNHEQKNLESLIARYKNLIPTIEVTMVKTEVFSKCYTYRREVREVVTLLNKVRDQTLNAPHPDSLDRVNKMIQEQQFSINQLDHQRTHIMSMLQRGKDLSKDVHAPAFVGAEVKNLETGWNEAYTETVDKLKTLRTTQQVWNDFADQKGEILSLLGDAETALRSITPLQTDPKNVSSDLKTKRELNINLQQASRHMIEKLHDLCESLTPMAAPEKKPILEKEVAEVEKRFFNTMEHVKDRVSYLEDYSAKWNSYKTRLSELQNWATNQAPQMIEALKSQDLSPEEKVAKVGLLQAVVSEKMKQLDVLSIDATELAPKEGNIAEAKRLKGDVFKLQEVLSAINRNVENQASAIKEDVANWHKYQAGIQEIKPWIEQSEVKVNTSISKPVTLQDAMQMQQQAKIFENQCEQQLGKLHDVASISNQMACKTNAPDELDAVHSRWTSVHDNAKQTSSKLEKLVAGWQSFDSDANKLESWIADGEKSIASRPSLLNTPQVDKLQKELVKLKSFNNEISEQQAKLVSLNQLSDQLSHGLAPEGAALVKERVGEMKAHISQLSEAVRAKINNVSDAIMARQDFNAQMATFSNWMDGLRGNIAQVEEINVERVEPSLQDIHALLQEHSDKKPMFNAIYNEVKEFALNATPEEAMILNESYTSLVSNFQELENNLLQKKLGLEKWTELLSWKNETDNHLTHIKRQLENSKPEELGTILEEIDDIGKSLIYWKNQAEIIDDNPAIMLRDKNTRKPINAVQMINDLENSLDNLKIQSQNKKDVLVKMEERKIKFNDLHKELAQNLTTNRQKYNQILRLSPNFSNIDQIISDLVALNESMNNQGYLKSRIHDEGHLLMKDDISSLPHIQESLLILDKEYDNLQQEINDRIQKYMILSQALKDYADSKDRFDKEIKKVNEVYEAIPTEAMNEHELMKVSDKTRKALDMIKKAKLNLDDLERKGNNLLKLLDTIENVPNDIASELDQSHKNWQDLHDKVAKNVHLYETEAVIWKQIEDSKNELMPWLSETSQSLCDAADNTMEIEFGPIRLNKYKSELPSYQNIKDEIEEKIQELTSMNKGVVVPELESLKAVLSDQFKEVEENANKLGEVASTFNDQEMDIRKNIKSSGEGVNKLREALIKCDDMSGDNSKIIERLKKCKELKGELYNCGDGLDNIKVRIDEMSSMYPTFSESIIPKEMNNVQKRFEGVVNHANKIEASLLQFLKKYHNDKLGQLQRIINTQKDKVAWCMPEATSDKYNLEVKKSSLNDVQKGKKIFLNLFIYF